MELHQTSGVPRVRTDEWDVPLGGLPGLSRVLLGRTHIEGAAAEVRFVSDQREVSETVARQVWEGLGTDVFSVFEPSTQMIVNIEITQQGPIPTQTSAQGWLLATSDRATAVTLLPTLVIVQTREYERFSTSLGDRLRRALELFTEASGVSLISRVGLRYINRLTDEDALSPVFWSGHIREPFAGPLNGPVAGLVTGAHQQTEMMLDATAGARVQSGVFVEQQPAGNDARYSYLVDIDVFREATMGYDAQGCSNQVRQLNRTALALFAQVLSDNYLEALKPAEVEPAVPLYWQGGGDR